MRDGSLSTQFVSSFLMSVAVSLTCAFIVMTLQNWLRRLRGCGGVLTFLLVVGLLLAVSGLISLVK